MAENYGHVGTLVRLDRSESVRIVLDDVLETRACEPVTVDILLRERPQEPAQQLAKIRIIHAEELDEMMDAHYWRTNVEDEPMTFGEASLLLIAVGVLLYLIYALLWPERF